MTIERCWDQVCPCVEAQRDQCIKLKLKSGLPLRPQDFGNDRVIRYLSRRAGNWEWNQPKRNKCIAVNKAEQSWRSEECFGIRHAEFRVFPAGFPSCFGPVFPHCAPSPFYVKHYCRKQKETLNPVLALFSLYCNLSHIIPECVCFFPSLITEDFL